MSEFFLSTDFGILLCVFFFGVGISGRLAAWVRAIHAGLVSLRKRTLRYRLAEAEKRSIELERQVIQSFKDMRSDFVHWTSRDTDLEDRIKGLEDIVVEFLDEGNDADFSKRKERAAEIVSFLKKKAKERVEAIKKIN